jgi:hypothetical protein
VLGGQRTQAGAIAACQNHCKNLHFQSLLRYSVRNKHEVFLFFVLDTLIKGGLLTCVNP